MEIFFIVLENHSLRLSSLKPIPCLKRQIYIFGFPKVFLQNNKNNKFFLGGEKEGELVPESAWGTKKCQEFKLENS